jgi:hypothetical protein
MKKRKMHALYSFGSFCLDYAYKHKEISPAFTPALLEKWKEKQFNLVELLPECAKVLEGENFWKMAEESDCAPSADKCLTCVNRDNKDCSPVLCPGWKQRDIYEEAIDKKIEEWHNSNSDLPLHEYLGWTEEKYKKWLDSDPKNDPDSLTVTFDQEETGWVRCRMIDCYIQECLENTEYANVIIPLYERILDKLGVLDVAKRFASLQTEGMDVEVFGKVNQEELDDAYIKGCERLAELNFTEERNIIYVSEHYYNLLLHHIETNKNHNPKLVKLFERLRLDDEVMTEAGMVSKELL